MHSTENKRTGAGRGGAHWSRATGEACRPFAGARFLTTAAEWRQLPPDGAPEVAFAGRSNAGKSSAINALANHTRLAYVSKTPGRTQHINFFTLRSGGLLADLPGYGYAAVPATARKHWAEFLARYLAERACLAGLVLVMDARRPLTALDHRMLEWLLPSGRPVHILLTKADKLTAAGAALALRQAQDALKRKYALHAHQLAAQLFSAVGRTGIDEAGAAVANWLQHYAEPEKERPRHQGE